MKPWSFCPLWIHRPQLSCALLFLTPLPLPHIRWMTLIPGPRRKQKSSKRWPMTTPRNITPTTAASGCCYSDCMDQCHARGLDPRPSLLSPTGSFPAGPVCPLLSGTPRWKNTLWNLTEVVLDLTPWTASLWRLAPELIQPQKDNEFKRRLSCQWMTGSRRARTIHPHSKASTSGKGAVFTKARQPLEFCARRSISASHDTAASSHCQNMGLVGSNLTQRDKLFVLALQLQHYKGHFMNDLSCYYECCKSRQTISVSLKT